MRSIYRSRSFYIEHLHAIIASVVMLLFVFVFWTGIAAATSEESSVHPAPGERIVTVFDQEQKQVVLTKADTVRSVLQQADIAIADYDIVEPGLDTKLMSTDFTINIYRAHPVMIIDGMRRQRILSPHSSPKDIAKDAKIELHDEDIVELGKPADIIEAGGGINMKITRATPVRLLLYGKTAKVYTQATTVAELLKAKNITLGKNDTMSVALSQNITANMKIEIWRNGVQTMTRDEPIPFSVRQIEDADQPVGYKKIKTPGKNGKKSVTYEVIMKNGKEKSRKKIQSVVINKPSEQVEIVGAKPSFSGDFAAALEKLRSCEGNYSSWNPAGPYYGAYQFDQGTWNSVSSAPYGKATPAQQDEAARKLYERRGWQPWPVCGAGLPDTYR